MGGNKDHSSTFRRLSLFPALPINLGISASQPTPSPQKSQDPIDYDNDPDLLLPVHPRRSSTSSTRSFFSRKRASSSSAPSYSSSSSSSQAPPTALGVTVIPSAPDHRPSPLSSTIPAPALSSTDFFVSPFIPSPLTATPSKNPFVTSSSSPSPSPSPSLAASSSPSAASVPSKSSSDGPIPHIPSSSSSSLSASPNSSPSLLYASKRLDPRRKSDLDSKSDPNQRWRPSPRVDEPGWRMVRSTIQHWITQESSPSSSSSSSSSLENTPPLEDLTDIVRKRSFHVASGDILMDLKETLAQSMILLSHSSPFSHPSSSPSSSSSSSSSYSPAKGLLLTELGRVWSHLRLNILPRLDALFYSLRSIPPSISSSSSSSSFSSTLSSPATRPRECVLAAFRDKFLLPLDTQVRDALDHWSREDELVPSIPSPPEDPSPPPPHDTLYPLKEHPSSSSSPPPPPPPPPPTTLTATSSLPPTKEQVGAVMSTLVQMCGMLCNVPGEPESRKSILSLWSCIVDHHSHYTTRVTDRLDRLTSSSDPSVPSSSSSTSVSTSSSSSSSGLNPSIPLPPSSSSSALPFTSLPPPLSSASPSLPPFIRPPYGGRSTRSGSVGSSFVFYTPPGRARSGTGPPLPSLPLVPVPSTSGHERMKGC
ncbi:MAG: hypothetical protein DHS80DRAFT_33228 [Piptocephalis tieghemiana]|nr:MAG: hypothetical protein DHS80DRAFT_33228 [Piptocephalis tieghemiana]